MALNTTELVQNKPHIQDVMHDLETYFNATTCKAVKYKT